MVRYVDWKVSTILSACEVAQTNNSIATSEIHTGTCPKMCNWDFVTSMETKDLSITDSYQVPTNLTINGYSVSRYKF